MPLKAAVLIQLAAGLRVGELCAIRATDIERTCEGQFNVSICRESLKGKVSFQIPLPDLGEVHSEYLSWKKENSVDSEYFFCDERGSPFSTVAVNAEVKLIGQMAGCSRPVTSHDMRRGYATLCNEFVSDPEISRRLTRHRQEATWWQYVRQPMADNVEKVIASLPVSKIATSYAIESRSYNKS